MSFATSSLNRRRFMQAGLAAGVGIVAAPSLTATGAAASTTTVGRVVTAEQAAQRVLAMATESVQLGSKGVGGLIMDNRTGKVIRESRNYRRYSSAPDEQSRESQSQKLGFPNGRCA